MCRLAAYIGAEIPLENIIIKPEHSLLEQSQDAREAKMTVNGDGFGIAWYDDQNQLGIYKDVLPAWADSNLLDICRMVKSKAFIAHIRASTFGATSRENCHPFAYDNWSFAHNGGIGEFSLIRRKIENLLGDRFYSARRGYTDSELVFLLILTNGLEDNVVFALEKTIFQISELVNQNNALSSPVRLTCVFSDGQKIYGFRYASDNKSPSLYISNQLDNGGQALASEPLHGDGSNWQRVEPGHLVELADGKYEIHSLNALD